MTDLTKVISELQRVTPADEIDAEFVSTILDAARTGDLLPRADADLAMALMVEKAADSLSECSVWCDSQERTDASWHNGVIDARKHHMATIRSLVHASAFSDLQVLRADRDVAIDSATQQDALRKATLATMRSISAENEDLRTELATLRAQVETTSALVRKLAYWLDTDAEVLADMDDRDMTDHHHIVAEVAKIAAALTEGAAP